MSDPCHGSEPGPGAGAVDGEEQRDQTSSVPRFLLGCDDDELDMGQMEAGMKNNMYREEDMEDDEDDSVGGRKLQV